MPTRVGGSRPGTADEVEGSPPGGVWVNQRLLVVSCTWGDPSTRLEDASGESSKICGKVNTLHFGTREEFATGVDGIFLPGLSMAQEFDRDDSWVDRAGVRYTLREEWAYATGLAKPKRSCTAGDRDMGHDGWSVARFRHEANEFIRARREAREEAAAAQGEGDHAGNGTGTGTGNGRARGLDAAFAFLSDADVIAVRLYTGPCYQPINTFLRQV